jgi:hypothetical protein
MALDFRTDGCGIGTDRNLLWRARAARELSDATERSVASLLPGITTLFAPTRVDSADRARTAQSARRIEA